MCGAWLGIPRRLGSAEVLTRLSVLTSLAFLIPWLLRVAGPSTGWLRTSNTVVLVNKEETS